MRELIRRMVCTVLYSVSVHFLPEQKAKKSTKAGVSLLLCHRDMTMVLHCLTALFFHLGYALPVYIVDDGSLTEDDKKKLNKHFTVQFEHKNVATKKLVKKYAQYPFFVKYILDSQTHIKKMKFGAFFLTPFEHTICIEPDILFLQHPKEVDTFIKEGGWYYGVLQPEIFELCVRMSAWEFLFRKIFFEKIKLSPHLAFNGGLMLYSKDMFKKSDFIRMEKLLKESYKVDYHRAFYFEEVLLSVIYAKPEAKLLSHKKYINLAESAEYTARSKPDRIKEIIMFHFTTYARPIIIYSSVKQLLRTRLYTRRASN